MILRLFIPAIGLLAACSAATPSLAEGKGSKWSFIEIDGQPPTAPKAWLEIREDRISANVGCNTVSGRLKFDEGRLIVSDLISTQMYCEAVMDQEQAVAEMLGAAPGFFIENGRMGIVSDKHKAELVRAADD